MRIGHEAMSGTPRVHAEKRDASSILARLPEYARRRISSASLGNGVIFDETSVENAETLGERSTAGACPCIFRGADNSESM